MKPILLVGATGFTGALCAQALNHAGFPFILAGRRLNALNAMAAEFQMVQGVRTIDVLKSKTLDQAFCDIDVVLTTVGPFREYGMAVVRAALESSTHYVDTTAEQSFQHTVYERYNDQAVEAGVTLLTGHACDYTLAYLGADLVNQRVGGMTRCESFHGLDPFQPSPGTALSALGTVKDTYLTFKDGSFEPQQRSLKPRLTEFPKIGSRYRAVPFPGGDTVLIPRWYPTLKNYNSSLLLPPRDAKGFAGFDFFRPTLAKLTPNFVLRQAADYLKKNLPHPTQEERAASQWHVIVEGAGPNGSASILLQGSNVYWTSAVCATLAAMKLAKNEAHTAGVTTTGRAFDAREFIHDLTDAGVVAHHEMNHSVI